MGLLRWLFGRRPRSDHGREAPATFARPSSGSAPESLHLTSHKFHGQCVVSPNGRFRLAWCDARAVTTAAGNHHWSGRGRYLLMQGNTVVVDGKLPRPNLGQVANNGTFILNDQGFENGLHGRLCAFHASGEQCLSVEFNAILFNCGLSDDGRLAACHTCNSDDENDGSVLAIFDLLKRREISRSRPPSGWPDYYDFAQDSPTIGLGYRQLGVFHYQLTGEFTDRAAWIEASLTKGDYPRAILMCQMLIQDAGRAPNPEVLLKILSSLDRVMPAIPDDKWRAVALKLRGIALDAQGFGLPALECFEVALSLDPKIGVKRHITRLRKVHFAAGARGTGDARQARID